MASSPLCQVLYISCILFLPLLFFTQVLCTWSVCHLAIKIISLSLSLSLWRPFSLSTWFVQKCSENFYWLTWIFPTWHLHRTDHWCSWNVCTTTLYHQMNLLITRDIRVSNPNIITMVSWLVLYYKITRNCAVCRFLIKITRCFIRTAWACCQIRKIAGAHAPGMPGTFSPSPQVSAPDMHHGTCVTHVPWCMPGLVTSGFRWNRRRGETFPAFPTHAQPAMLCIW